MVVVMGGCFFSFFFFINSMHLWIYLLLYRAWGYHLYHLSGFKAVVCLLVFFIYFFSSLWQVIFFFGIFIFFLSIFSCERGIRHIFFIIG